MSFCSRCSDTVALTDTASLLSTNLTIAFQLSLLSNAMLANSRISTLLNGRSRGPALRELKFAAEVMPARGGVRVRILLNALPAKNVLCSQHLVHTQICRIYMYVYAPIHLCIDI